MQLVPLWAGIVGALLVSASIPTRTLKEQRWADDTTSPFVTTQDGQFMVNGTPFRFVGTNAYWLSALNSEQDVINTLSNISAANVTVVRTWAFNDVDTIPENGTWFQLIANGTATINNGTNGLQKLDMVVKHAQNFGIYLMLTLTNNWNPLPLLDNLTAGIESLSDTVQSPPFSRRDVTPGTNNSLARNTLSNDYGGMDFYVRQFGHSNHDVFYTNETIITAFENYTTQVISRYVNSPAVLAWEIANDPRCNSSIAATPSCNATTVTRWHSRIAKHIRSVDPNHLVSSGNQGFFCIGCPKLFPLSPTPPPQTSPVPGRRNVMPLNKERLLKERKERRKKTRAAALQSKRSNTDGTGIRIRGNWVSTATRRQDVQGIGPAFDGSQGVDSEDIINIPQIGFGTFQLFPDQNEYEPADPSLPAFNNTVQTGITWIQQQAQLAKIFGKPMSLTGFGLVTQGNAPFFVPFNTSVAPFGPNEINNASGTVPTFGVTDQQRDEAYKQWLDTGILGGLQGLIQYQWGQGNLTAENGTAIASVPSSNGVTPVVESNGVSPNDGYSLQGPGAQGAQGVMQEGAQEIANLTSSG